MSDDSVVVDVVGVVVVVDVVGINGRCFLVEALSGETMVTFRGLPSVKHLNNRRNITLI